jgi:aryl-alcohol dehydrogenase-like predicted oxidoreductase
LASGLLTGKYNKGIPQGTRVTLPGYEYLKESVTDKAKLDKVARLQTVSAGLGVPLAQMALAWLLRNPNVSSVITGASRVEQVKENMKAVDVVAKMTPEVMESIRVILDE